MQLNLVFAQFLDQWQYCIYNQALLLFFSSQNQLPFILLIVFITIQKIHIIEIWLCGMRTAYKSQMNPFSLFYLKTYSHKSQLICSHKSQELTSRYRIVRANVSSCALQKVLQGLSLRQLLNSYSHHFRY